MIAGLNRDGLVPIEITKRQPVAPVNRRAICDACSWNVNNRCEHIGCSMCGRQRRGGGLYEILKIATYRCPAGKF